MQCENGKPSLYMVPGRVLWRTAIFLTNDKVNMMDAQYAIEILLKHEALLVHCAGLAKMIGNETTNNYEYLERLKVAAKGNLELACSTVRKGDWTSLENIRNYTGSCGLVLRPEGPDAVTYCWMEDAGTKIGANGRRDNVTEEAKKFPLEAAITKRQNNKYNEVGVLGYSVIGIFTDCLEFEYSIPECQISARLEALGNPDPEHPDYVRAYAERINQNDVIREFPHLDVFLLKEGQLEWVRKDGRGASGLVEIADIYKR